jgi:hypothetical protein
MVLGSEPGKAISIPTYLPTYMTITFPYHTIYIYIYTGHIPTQNHHTNKS